MSEPGAVSFVALPGPAGCTTLTIDLGECEAVVDLPCAKARKLIRALAAAIGDGFERTHGTEVGDV